MKLKSTSGFSSTKNVHALCHLPFHFLVPVVLCLPTVTQNGCKCLFRHLIVIFSLEFLWTVMHVLLIKPLKEQWTSFSARTSRKQMFAGETNSTSCCNNISNVTVSIIFVIVVILNCRENNQLNWALMCFAAVNSINVNRRKYSIYSRGVSETKLCLY